MNGDTRRSVPIFIDRGFQWRNDWQMEMDSFPQLYPIAVVRAIIVNPQGRILLLQRQATAYEIGSWCLPGGKVEYGQTLEEALAKEIREETSLRLIDADFFFC